MSGRTVAWATYRENGSQAWLSLTHIRKDTPPGAPQRTLCGKQIPLSVQGQIGPQWGTTGRGTCSICADIGESR